MTTTLLTIASFLSGVIAAVLFTPVAIRWARQYNFMDQPGGRKIHSNATPLLGGLAVFAATWFAPMIIICAEMVFGTGLVASSSFVFVLFFAGLAMMLLGMVDDHKGMRARFKFLIQVPVAVALVQAGVMFTNITVPGIGTVSLGIWGAPLSVLFLVGVTNAVNLVDGMDGLASGVSLIAALVVAALAALAGHMLIALVMLSMAGACLGFLKFNFTNAKVFLGDAGSLFLGMTLGAAVIQVEIVAGTSSLLVVAAVLGYPIADTFLAMTRRALQNKSLFSPDRSHVHHALKDMGLSQKQAVFALYGLAALMGVLALALTSGNAEIVVSAVAALIVYVSLGMVVMGSAAKQFLGLVPAAAGASEEEEVNAENNNEIYAEAWADLRKYDFARLNDTKSISDYLRTACEQMHVSGLKVSIPEVEEGQAFNADFEMNDHHNKDIGISIPPTTVNVQFEDTGMQVSVSYSLTNAPQVEAYLNWWPKFKEVAEKANLRLKELKEPQPQLVPLRIAA